MKKIENGKNYIMFLVLFIGAILISMSQLKVSAAMTAVADCYNISMEQSAMLMSIFTVAGIFLAIPGAMIMKKIGPRKLGIALFLFLGVGNVIGAITYNYKILMLSRLIEGISYSMIIMVGITFIHQWFASGGANLIIGIFNTFAAVGSFLVMNIARITFIRQHVKLLWWGTAVLAFAVCLGFIFLVKDKRDELSIMEKEENVLFFKSSKVLGLAIIQMLMAFILFGYITCYPLLFTQYYHLSQETANFYAGLNGLFGIPACILCGILIEKTKKPYFIAKIGLIGTAITGLLLPYLLPGTYVIHVLASAIFPGGFVMTAIFCIVPTLSKKQGDAGSNMGIVNLCYYIGVFFATPVWVNVTKESWHYAIPLVVCTCGMALFLLIVITRRDQSSL